LLPTYAAALLHAQYTDQPVYLYSYEHLNEGTIRVLDITRFVDGLRLGRLLATPDVKSVRDLRVKEREWFGSCLY
jgi:hypothetical protein